MYNLRRIFNQNKRQILIAILAIVFAIVVIKLLNVSAKQRAEERKNEPHNVQTGGSNYNPSYSIVTGDKVDEEKSSKKVEIIDKFIDFCNNKDIQSAYNLLSDDCKNELYPTIEVFKQTYYNANFNTQKIHTVQLWVGYSYTYKVDLYEDGLANGKIETTNSKQDYFTIVEENGEQKLNINEYIGKQIIDKKTTKNNIIITVEYKRVYKDYEIYTIQVENKTENTILLDSMENTKTMYLQGSSGAEYTSYSYEINKSSLQVKSYYKNTLDIKYNKQYTTDSIAKSVIFSDIVLNEQEYKSSVNKKQYTNRTQIEIEL